MIYCIIPAKPYPESKTRLAPLLSPERRLALSRRLLRRTIGLARGAVGRVLVVSRDESLLAEVRAWGAWGLPETIPGLNPALTLAACFAQVRGASGLLVLPADLPFLKEEHLEAVLTLASVSARGDACNAPGRGPTVVIAPCRHGTGTNALLTCPPHFFPFAFGPDSFAAHCAAVRAAGVEPIVYRAHGLAFDLDTPEDWKLMRSDRLADSIQAW